MESFEGSGVFFWEEIVQCSQMLSHLDEDAAILATYSEQTFGRSCVYLRKYAQQKDIHVDSLESMVEWLVHQQYNIMCTS